MKLTHDKVYISGRNVVFEKKCSVTGETYRVEVDLLKHQRWQEGALIQNAMPNLDADQREFVRIGLTPAEYDQMYSGMDDE